MAPGFSLSLVERPHAIQYHRELSSVARNHGRLLGFCDLGSRAYSKGSMLNYE